MEGILVLMFFLGAMQLTWALIAVLFSRRREVRVHLGYYLISVLGYFAFLVVYGLLYNNPMEQIPFLWHFFANAGGLALYHANIVSLPYDAELEGAKISAPSPSTISSND